MPAGGDQLLTAPTVVAAPHVETAVPVANSPPASYAAPVPTPKTHVYATPGVYTQPAVTITVTQATTVCAAATTKVAAGTHTLGGVTTVVEAPTTVVVPVATVVVTGSVTTSTVPQIEYACPSAGTYTVAPITTVVTKEAVVPYPTPAVYEKGVYTAPEKVVHVTETNYVYYCPFTKSGLPTPAPQATKAAPPPPPPPPPPPASTYEAPVPSATEEAPPLTDKIPAVSDEVDVPMVTTQKEIPHAPAYKKPSPPAYQPPKHGGGGGGKLENDNDHFGITYTPYQPANGKCKSAKQVDKDMAVLSGADFTTVRVYSTDCNTLEHVGNACQKHKMQMIVGIFVKDKGCSYDAPAIREQIDQLAWWDKWGLVSLVVVGNEAIMNGHCTARQLSDLVVTVKSKCFGYKGRYTISETFNVWQRPEVQWELCGVVDVTGANIHPYFNANVSPAGGGDFVASQLALLAKICGHKDVINLECGWPSCGNCNGSACPGKTQQAAAIRSIRNKTGSKTVFSYEDDLWKEAGSCGCEQSWGTAASFAVTTSY